MKKTERNKGNTIKNATNQKSHKKQVQLEDTLEFLSLDDETIENYGRQFRRDRSATKITSRERYEMDKEIDEDEDDDIEELEEIEEEYEDEEDELYDEDEEIALVEDDEEEFDDEDYEELDEDEEDDDEDEYDEEDDEEDDDDEYEEDDYDYEGMYDGNIIERIGYFIVNMNPLDHMMFIFGCFILIAAVITGSFYVNAKTKDKQVEAFAEVGTEVENIGVIGESGLLAVSNAEAARIALMLEPEQELEEQQAQVEEEAVAETIEVTMNLTSIQSDLKIKFNNAKTGKLIGGVPFEVEVSGGSKTFQLKDDDKDGIIYTTGIAAGTYTVKVLALDGTIFQKYQLPTKESSVKVTDQIAYKKVDVADEIKSESEVNAAAEDTAKHAETESALTDTVEWVESTKTEVNSEESYNEIKKTDIPDPSTLSQSGFIKFAETSEAEEQLSDKELNEKKLETLNPVLNTTSVDLDMSKETTAALSISVSSGESYHVDWNSSDTSVASVSDGVVTAVANGSAKITATVTVGEKSAASKKLTCTVNVAGGAESKPEPTPEPTPETPSQEYKMKSIKGGGTIQIGKTCTVSGTTEPEGGKITWSSKDTSIATVDSDGVVTGVSEGETTIRGTSDSGDYKECSVTVVSEEVVYKSVTITGSATIQVGKTGTVKGTTEPAGGTVTWTSDNEDIVKIDSDGKMTGVSEGEATITGTCGDVKDTWKVTVTKEEVKDDSKDTKSKLKDKDGNQIYVKNEDGKYVEATYADYFKDQKFYLQKKAVTYIYTGWQTIDGYTYFYDKNGNYVTGDQVIQGARYSFGSDGRLSSGSGTLGIDVSKWNGSIDWNAVKNSGISYVIIRCGYRGSSTGALIEDPKFASNIKGAKAAGLKVGVYFFSQAVNEVEAVEEASMALKLVSGYGLNYPIFLDVEDSGGRGDRIDVATRTAVCKAFCATVQSSGYSAGIYANKSWFTSKINTGSLTSYKIWLAQYASAPSYTATKYDMWQYSSKGTVKGISGNVDMNISYMNY